MSQELFNKLDSYRRKKKLSILALCRKLQIPNVTYHRWKKTNKITGAYKKIIQDFLDKNESINLTSQIASDSQQSKVVLSSFNNSQTDIAVIGMACYYPGASTIKELWENILARRIQFRRILDQRLPLKDYYSEDASFPDKTYLTKAAFIDGFEFNWSKLRIPKKTFLSTDIVHWLALDTAIRAFEDAGYNLEQIPILNTGVILGNTLTGEQTRSQLLRLRWPYVQKTLYATLDSFGIPDEEKKLFSETMEKFYKSAFYPITEDSLAGGLANTIAGRICNYLNLKAGGYIVDGACSSSLLAVATASNALKLGQIDLVLAGGVDVSLDPFELVGFAKAGALAKEQMCVYDRRANGFIPGEGCGFVVLKRLEDAIRDKNYIYAVIKGWGISSDGKGGIMEPSASGQANAIQRAYKNSGYTIADIDFIEGHGTGTTKGDRVELEGIVMAIKNVNNNTPSRTCGVTSFKSIVGHTKAAAGIGGFIKAVLAVNQRILPPTANCKEPNEIFEKEATQLYPIIQGRIYPEDRIIRAGISSAGFGGINCHITIESKDKPNDKIKPQIDERALLVSNQNTELFVFASKTIIHLIKLIQKFKDDLRNISLAEMADLSARVNKKVRINNPIKIAVVTDTPEHLYEALCTIEQQLPNQSPQEGELLEIKSKIPSTYILLGNCLRNQRIGFLFPGQGSQRLNMARTIVERFSWARELLNITELPIGQYIYKSLDQFLSQQDKQEFERQLSQTEITQPAIVFSCLVWNEFLSQLGIQPQAVGGHSLGELLAFYRAGAFDKETLLKFAEFRGKVMADKNSLAGMVSLFCDYTQAEALVNRVKADIVIANINSPKQTIVSGEKKGIEEIIKLAEAEGVPTYVLAVSNAFHSHFMQSASKEILTSKILSNTFFRPTNINFYSCMSGDQIREEINLREYFAKQVISPVNFVKLVESISKECDLLIEVGPGKVLTNLVKAINKDKGPVCFPVEGTPQDDKDLNIVLAQAFVRNIKINWEELYKNRLIRPFIPVSRRKFIQNQCERPLKAVVPKEKLPIFSLSKPTQIEVKHEQIPAPLVSQQPPMIVSSDYISTILIDLAHKLTGFDKQSLSLNLRLLDDLNLDSIKAAELIGEAGKILGLSGQIDPSQYSNYTLLEIRDLFLKLKTQISIPPTEDDVLRRYQNRTWVRDFVVKLQEEQIKQIDSKVLERFNKIDILCEHNQDTLASKLRQMLQNKKVQVGIQTYEELDKRKTESSGDSDCFICLLSFNYEQGVFTEFHLKQIINRLYQIMRQATGDSSGKDSLRESAKAKMVVFVGFGGGDFGENDKLKNVQSCCARSFASTLHLERPDLSIKVIDFDQAIATEVICHKIIEELQVEQPFSLVGYDRNIKRTVPVFQNVQPAFYRKRNIRWSSQDVVLVTGGAKGITAECALRFGQKTKARLILVGRSKLTNQIQNQDNEIIRNLERFRKEKLQYEYYSCDVTNLNEVKQLVDKIEKSYGKITAVIHGAGLNTIKRLKQTNPEDAYQEALPKVLGMVNICKVLENNPLKLMLAITSVIGLTGMEGSGWYGLSNEILNLLLHQFKANHKATEVVTIAYSAWNEVGMGSKLGSLDWLLRKGINLIPIEEGVKRFMNLVEKDSGAQQTIVVARVGRLDTWRSSQTYNKTGLRFIEDIKYHMPGVELIAQAHLNIKDDAYVLEHSWKGTLLFPLVFGLEAMTQAAVFLAGEREITALKASNIHLDRPIPISQESGTKIEIHAEVLESDNHANKPSIKVEIFSEQDNFTQPAFSAVIEIAEKADIAVRRDEDKAIRYNAKRAIELNLEEGIYGKILFQGKSFQRISCVHTLFYDEKKEKGECIFTSEYNKSIPEFFKQNQKFSNQLLIGDPFFIDSMFQSMQLIIPQDICLPNHIEEIELSIKVDLKNNKGVAKSDIKKIDRDYYTGNAEVFDKGKLLIRIKDCRLKILDTLDDNPTANDLVNPLERDQKIIDNKLKEIAQQFKIELPTIKCFYDSRFKSASKNKRHKIETTLIKATASEFLRGVGKQVKDIRVKWDKDGRPIIEGKNLQDINVSLSHCTDLLICTAGYGPQGCDVEIVQKRNDEDWLKLLGTKKYRLYEELRRGNINSDFGGTAIWSAYEAINKTYNNHNLQISIDKIATDYISFFVNTSSKDEIIIAFKTSLTRGGKKVIAVLAKQKIGLRETEKYNEDDFERVSLLKKIGYDENAFRVELSYSGPQEQLVFIKRYPITFKSNKLLSKRVYFTSYFDWMGEIREQSASPIMEYLAGKFESGVWGIATYSTKLKILGELKASDVLEANFWAEETESKIKGTYDLCIDWKKITPHQAKERVAFSRQRIIWVKIISRGIAKAVDLPEFIEIFMDTMKPRIEKKKQLEELPERYSMLKKGKELLSLKSQIENKYLLLEKVVNTTLEHSNLIGNIYFSNYAKWLAMVMDLYFYKVIPEYYQGLAEKGELVCINCEINHLNEAMPFDDILIKMYLDTLYTNGIDLGFDFYLMNGEKGNKKLANAKFEGIWVQRSPKDEVYSIELPVKFINQILKNQKI